MHAIWVKKFDVDSSIYVDAPEVDSSIYADAPEIDEHHFSLYYFLTCYFEKTKILRIRTHRRYITPQKSLKHIKRYCTIIAFWWGQCMFVLTDVSVLKEDKVQGRYKYTLISWYKMATTVLF